MVSQCSEHQSTPAPSIGALSIDDFDQGQDDEFHPEVRALVESGKFTKDAVRNMKPVAPKSGTVIPDYNPILDEVRPKKMDDYIRDYRIFFVIDDSGSMVPHWNETRDALSEIADYALNYHTDTIDIRFFNSGYSRRGVRGMKEVMGAFRSVSPSNGTPTGPVLKEVLDQQLDRLNAAQSDGTYSSERPLDIIVLTDGVPNQGPPPATVIEEAAKRFKAAGHHQNWVGIQFVQIGDDENAGPTLLSLIDCANNNHMVDTISYSLYKEQGGGKLTPQILKRIILGALHPNLRSYWNQFRHKVNERTSQVIY
ncbi:hypothetical protein AGABI2DRAFT_188345 [Agaricus bisporus var. bisporus H97]|uniref:hypothetical protein n=1 Tax=Agaricus bisporus var. bisporus (strain H97 / ATCC MYA-4626 / FGSC 10389) TaxID=936046 RepID=UPI00029F6DE6|nr:hypothetical protein AGABI2DRAFT_188345 [Agaricus bisporus var. bisporus H97]EKV42706.1 hypothetical protein AGABI2DRAFT_188345 [Agaricus bisporus var. bisporus H97]